jgi:probable HAF family extracellular repeat protein
MNQSNRPVPSVATDLDHRGITPRENNNMKNTLRKLRLHPLRPRRLATALRLAFAAPLFACGLVHAQDGITDLGTLGGVGSFGYGVSADGAVVVGESNTAGNQPHAFRWTSGGGMVDLGTLGGTTSYGYGVSADGAVVVGYARTAGNAASHAFRWTSGGGMVDLGTLGGTRSIGYGVSADGLVVVGEAETQFQTHAFRWTSGGMADLGTLGGTSSASYGVSADGAVVVGEANTAGNAATHAFRWTSGGGMADLGTLGGTDSISLGVSSDGAVVVGQADMVGGASHAFRWTSGGGMADLGTLGGTHSNAWGISADGAVVVGWSHTAGNAATRAIRWSQASGMQTVEDWLRAAGVTVPIDITNEAHATNSDGSVVVGQLDNGQAFIARVAPVGSGLVTLADVQQSLTGTAIGGDAALSTAGLVWNGAHSRPLSRRVAVGQKTFWLAGDWGTDDHGGHSGDLGLAEVGFGQNFGSAQVNVSLGQTWAKQNLVLNGSAKSDGTYLLAEALIPVQGNLWATLGGYGHWGQADLRRGYLNTGAQDYSTGKPDADTWSLRARLDWEQAWRATGTGFGPYVDLTYSEAKLAAYTETDGGFPARFDARTDKATELRAGVNATKPLDNGLTLLGTLEAAHRFEQAGARTSGELVGLFAFDLDGRKNQQDWLRAGVGMEGKLAEGVASVSLNLTTQGETPNTWLAASWRKAF